MNEAETRAEHVDPALAAAGWGVVEGSRVRREYPITLGRIEGQGRRGTALSADSLPNNAMSRFLIHGSTDGSRPAASLLTSQAPSCARRTHRPVRMNTASPGPAFTPARFSHASRSST